MKRIDSKRWLLVALVGALARCACAIRDTGVLEKASASPAAAKHNNRTRIVFLTDCTPYSDWQSVVMVFSYNRTRQPADGSLSKVMCCSEKDFKRYPKAILDLVPTHVAPSFTYNNKTNDWYVAYNKPGAVYDWLKHETPEEEWLLVLDSDMYLRKPFYTSFYNVSKGWCLSHDYRYMIGVNNELATRHIPEIGPRNDTLAGPYGRRGDQVGGFFYAHRDDMKRLSPLWLQYTEDVREDPEAWRLTGDQYVKKGGKAWISEMYGYSFGAAKAGVWHMWDTITMIYPGRRPDGIPRVIHYGLKVAAGNWTWDKHSYFHFDVTKCPPWKLTGDPTKWESGIFPPPPRPSELDQSNFMNFYRDLISVETVATINAAFCTFHVSNCPPSAQLKEVCDEAFRLYDEVHMYIAEVEAHHACRDWHPECARFKAAGQCEANPGFMHEDCRHTCGVCGAEHKLPKDLDEVIKERMAKLPSQHVWPVDWDPDRRQGAQGAAPDKSSPSPEPSPSPSPSPSAVEATKDTDEEGDSMEVETKEEAKVDKEDEAARPAIRRPGFPPMAPKAPVGMERRVKQLTISCYRLGIEEVEDCVKAAKKGHEWKGKTGKSSAGGDAFRSQKLSRSDVLSHDIEDLSLTRGRGAAAPDGGEGSLLSSLTAWQSAIMWVVIVLAFLMVVPRIARLSSARKRGGGAGRTRVERLRAGIGE
ncbi:hypothetical protein HYH03_003212 [Edaphochlamys debaryana]|uniref:ShKT domain-containing protein n=1 Tax=Edaphochlamys debaryana TaxID=47281 RepID=A0A835YCH0_9CHLO|nr:hypothetical protein HYH03_003212 [Edaphochlamys debaryana]|eukprot:KAG2499027.1 hypothetical protein HYH03_003212 [Edaphochlamys debaryana]